ncbi:MAG: hypothetical protein ACTHLA_00745 [Asticcacaulis sp.]|uniref:hypothetical protein n=1 Tax=Asticcacaulis sp. TaxID=1872648 RepID=UPI003F7B860F
MRNLACSRHLFRFNLRICPRFGVMQSTPSFSALGVHISLRPLWSLKLRRPPQASRLWRPKFKEKPMGMSISASRASSVMMSQPIPPSQETKPAANTQLSMQNLTVAKPQSQILDAMIGSMLDTKA